MNEAPDLPPNLSRVADPFEDALAAELARIEDAGLKRRLRQVAGIQAPAVTIDGAEVLLFCSNNYLGLADHPEVIAAACRATELSGASAVSSRLVSGHMSPHADLEARIANWKGTESALVFSTGYQANIGAITSLVGPGSVVFSDELNHASLIDGCRLSRADVVVYRHNDVDHLRELLAEHRRADTAPKAITSMLIATESVFSMDGDVAPLADIVALAQEFGAAVMVDEAHAAGVFGPRGAGVAADLGLTDAIDVHVGTLGKALGSFGAYVAGSAKLIDLLINRARSFIFTTGLPPASAAAAEAAINITEREPERREGLLARARHLAQKLRNEGLEVPPIDSQIIPVMIGAAADATAVADELLQRGVYVAAIRPPTVPEGTSRLRLSLMATHNEQQIERAASEIIRAVRKVRGATKENRG